jgi:hypothetical protein
LVGLDELQIGQIGKRRKTILLTSIQEFGSTLVQKDNGSELLQGNRLETEIARHKVLNSLDIDRFGQPSVQIELPAMMGTLEGGAM